MNVAPMFSLYLLVERGSCVMGDADPLVAIGIVAATVFSVAVGVPLIIWNFITGS